MKPIKILVEKIITEEIIKNILITSHEGGMTSTWCQRVRPVKGDWVLDKDRCIDWMGTMKKAGGIKYQDNEGKWYVLTGAKIKKGAQALTKKYPHIMDKILTENDDANDADVFVQCCLFGREVYA